MNDVYITKYTAFIQVSGLKLPSAKYAQQPPRAHCEIFAKKWFFNFFFFFLAVLVKIFKNKKLIKRVRKYSLDTRI